METEEYLKILTDEIHSAIVATIDKNGHPVTRCIDMMLYDEKGVYFLTAAGKEFYEQLMEQKYVSISAIMNKRCISLNGMVKNIGHEKLDEIFVKNPYMQKIYPEGTRDVLQVFCIYEGEGNFFDISDPAHVTRGTFKLGNGQIRKSGYFIEAGCINCGRCLNVCPQKCIDMHLHPALIHQNNCLHCGQCMSVCPAAAIHHYA